MSSHVWQEHQKKPPGAPTTTGGPERPAGAFGLPLGNVGRHQKSRKTRCGSAHLLPWGLNRDHMPPRQASYRCATGYILNVVHRDDFKFFGGMIKCLWNLQVFWGECTFLRVDVDVFNPAVLCPGSASHMHFRNISVTKQNEQYPHNSRANELRQ